MGHSPKISIIGGTIWGNRGAESMLTTTIGMISRIFPDARFVVFSYYPVKDRQLVGDKRVTILSGTPISLATRHFLGAIIGWLLRIVRVKIPTGKFFKIARMLSESDLLLDIGGITFSDGREKFLPFNILSIWPAMLMGVPVVKMAQAVGPFRRPLNRICAKLFLTRCSYIFSRGEKTYEYLKNLRFSQKSTEQSADIAFLYEQGFSLSNENNSKVDTLVEKLKKARAEGKKIVVFSPSVLVEDQFHKMGLDYIDGFLHAATILDADSHHFVVMPNATRAGSKNSHNNDLLTIAAMRDRSAGILFPKPSIEWVDYDINTASIRRIIQQANVLVTSRYHAMISGLCLRVPTLVIGWSHKYKETMEYFDLAQYALDFGKDDVHIAESVAEMLEKEDIIRTKIRKALPHVRKISQQQFNYLGKVLS